MALFLISGKATETAPDPLIRSIETIPPPRFTATTSGVELFNEAPCNKLPG